MQPVLKDKKIVIVGGGLAGLYAAYLLKRSGAKIVVLEALDRVGGRVQSFKHDKGVIEAGADWIGARDRIWLGLAQTFGLDLVDVGLVNFQDSLSPPLRLWLKGNHVPTTDLQNIQQEMSETLRKISQASVALSHPAEPWLEDSYIRVWDRVSVAQILKQWGVSRRTRHVLRLWWENVYGANLDQYSWLGVLCQIQGEMAGRDPNSYWNGLFQYHCRSGNQSLCNRLCQSIESHYQAEIYLQAPVKKVAWFPETEKFTIDFGAYQTRLESDYVVLAIPPSQWKRIHFDPELDFSGQVGCCSPAVKYMGLVVGDGMGTTSNSYGDLNFSRGLHDEGGLIWSPDSDWISVRMGGQWALSALQRIQRHSIGSFRNRMRKSLYEYFLPQAQLDFVYDAMSLYGWHPFIRPGYHYLGVGHVLTTAKRNYQRLSWSEGKLFLAGDHCVVTKHGFMEGALQSGANAVRNILQQAQIDDGERE
jgi:monoamine oxidase